MERCWESQANAGEEAGWVWPVTMFLQSFEKDVLKVVYQWRRWSRIKGWMKIRAFDYLEIKPPSSMKAEGKTSSTYRLIDLIKFQVTTLPPRPHQEKPSGPSRGEICEKFSTPSSALPSSHRPQSSGGPKSIPCLLCSLISWAFSLVGSGRLTFQFCGSFISCIKTHR